MSGKSEFHLVDDNENDLSKSVKLIRKINTVEHEDYDEKDDEGLMKICNNILNNKPFLVIDLCYHLTCD